MRLLAIFGLISVLLGFACGRSRLSDREVRREQIRLNAETKKRELGSIKGDYTGDLGGGTAIARAVLLHLDVVEAPFNDNGGIDPIMMPQISGYLKIYSGSDAFDNLNIVRGEFDPKRSVLELGLKDERLGEMQLSLVAAGKGFAGEWQAPSLSMSGSVTLAKGLGGVIDPSRRVPVGDLPADGIQNKLAGTYVGYANDDSRSNHFAATFVVRSMTIPGQGVKLTVDVKLSRGDDGAEFAIWKFENPEFHPIDKRLTMRKSGSNENFTLTMGEGSLTGDWTSSVHGRMGVIAASKMESIRSTLPRATRRTGVHEVCLNSFGDAKLPRYASVTTTVVPELGADGKVKIQASIIFYLGSYQSSERFTCVLEQVDLDYISGRFYGVCRSLPHTEPLSISGTFSDHGFSGRITASGGSGADIQEGRCGGAM